MWESDYSPCENASGMANGNSGDHISEWFLRGFCSDDFIIVMNLFIWQLERFSIHAEKSILNLVKTTETSIAHHMSNTRREYSREILLTIFSLVILNEVSWSFKMNGNFRHNHIPIYYFTAKWICSSFLVTTMILVTMIPSIHKNVYNPFGAVIIQ